MRFKPFINYYDTLVEYYSFTEQKNFRSHELIGSNSSIQYFRPGHYFLDIQYISLIAREQQTQSLLRCSYFESHNERFHKRKQTFLELEFDVRILQHPQIQQNTHSLFFSFFI